jgi:tryptophanyl-tRNA synthetase
MRILSAMQPSGALHLGNYLGSMRPNLEMSKTSDDSFFFIVDLHALTTVHDAKALKKYREECIRDYLAAGFDPTKATVFYQSWVPEHAELAWILSTVTPMGLLERAVSYKDKVEKGIAASVGLFTYPVLMAADILLYQSDVVPVGKDQKQHVEMTRDIAIKFNATFGDTFVIPEPKIREDVAVVPGTDGQKMSKSYGNTIPLFGTDAEIKKAIMGIVTDSTGPTEPKDPETCTVYNIHKLLLSEGDAKTLADDYRKGISYGDAKKRLLEDYLAFVGPMREKRAALTDAEVEAVLKDGTAKASAEARKTMEKVRKAVGLR